MNRACFFERCAQPLAVDGAAVRRVVEVRQLTRVPRTPAALLGLFAAQGVIYPLFDALREPGQGAPPLAVLIGSAEHVVGIAADRVIGFMDYRADDAAQPPAALAGVADGVAVAAAVTAARLDADVLVAKLIGELEQARGRARA